MIEADRVRRSAEDVVDGIAYQDLRSSPIGRFLSEVRSWIAERIFDLLTGSAAANVGVVIAVVVVAAVVVLGVIALLGARRRAAVDLVVDEAVARTPDEALAAADTARADGRLADAVRGRYGALLLVLVERDVLPELPGLTVGEVNAAVARTAPVCAAAVTSAGEALADIVYGHRPATAADDDEVAMAVQQVRAEIPRRAVAV